ncbi:hypothetical protein [Nocardia sp. NPDC005366]|uniref:hypothetical protein n=1 Tax=Nocardia sp. NPDC005366 TaxID=3156878 RepID=UPI0033AF370C
MIGVNGRGPGVRVLVGSVAVVLAYLLAAVLVAAAVTPPGSRLVADRRARRSGFGTRPTE